MSKIDAPWWSSSPIVVVPLSFAALGMAFVPFIVWGTDHAAQFFGSFIAALVAAGAVIGGARYQSSLAVAREDRANIREELRGKLYLYAFIDHAIDELGVVHRIFDQLTFRNEPGATEADDDFSHLSVESIKAFMPDFENLDFDHAISIGLMVPNSIGAQAIVEILNLRVVWDYLRMRAFQPDHQIVRSVASSIVGLTNTRITRLERLKVSLRAELKKDGVSV